MLTKESCSNCAVATLHARQTVQLQAWYIVDIQSQIKINGVIWIHDQDTMKMFNYDLMTGEIIKHLKDWSECSLSLLDKIQIFNTFSISQYLHAVIAFDISTDQ